MLLPLRASFPYNAKMTFTWNIRGIQHHLGDDVFIASGVVFLKVRDFA